MVCKKSVIWCYTNLHGDCMVWTEEITFCTKFLIHSERNNVSGIHPLTGGANLISIRNKTQYECFSVYGCLLCVDAPIDMSSPTIYMRTRHERKPRTTNLHGLQTDAETVYTYMSHDMRLWYRISTKTQEHESDPMQYFAFMNVTMNSP